jgi:H+/gluconate symporter-like permease
MVVAMVPLLIAKGAGAASRFDIGLVIAAGMTIGTMFTLFVTPAVYTYLARDHQKARARAEAPGEPIVVHPTPAVEASKAPVGTPEEADEETQAGTVSRRARPSPAAAEALAFASPAVGASPLERRASKRERRRRRLPTAAE